jgi:hypothetical protein
MTDDAVLSRRKKMLAVTAKAAFDVASYGGSFNASLDLDLIKAIVGVGS